MGLHGAQSNQEGVGFSAILRFFIPLALSASLVTVSHVIIHSTLARAFNPAVVIASYSIAMNIFGIMERIAVMLRPTSAALVKDKISFRQMLMVSVFVLAAIFLVSIAVAFSPMGIWIFSSLFHVKGEVLHAAVETYQVLLFVTIFSGARCLFQGMIISQFRTKWLTIGMVIRLLFMGGVAVVVIQNKMVSHGKVGACIFLIGMAIEALVSFLEGMHVVKELPEKTGNSIDKKTQIFQFYWPLLVASLVAVTIGPAINIMLGWSRQAEIAIASYAIAFSVTQLFLSFTSYIHQVVLNFYEKDFQLVIRFMLLFSLLPAMMLGIIAYSSLGVWLLENLMGVTGQLLNESLKALKFFVWMALFFPWLDFVNGLLMVKKQTRIMSFSQFGNVASTIALLFLLNSLFPNEGGMIGSFSQSVGVFVELSIVAIYVYFTSYRQQGMMKKFTEKSLHFR